MRNIMLTIIEDQINVCKDNLIKHNKKLMEEGCQTSKEQKLIETGALYALIKLKNKVRDQIKEGKLICQ